VKAFESKLNLASFSSRLVILFSVCFLYSPTWLALYARLSKFVNSRAESEVGRESLSGWLSPVR